VSSWPYNFQKVCVAVSRTTAFPGWRFEY
jgi:hypothetical protein